MSKIGNKPIDLPEDLILELFPNRIIVKGKYGSLEKSLEAFLQIQVKNKKLFLLRTEESTKAKTFHGLVRALLQNMILGVSQKFRKTLLAEGVGYKFQLEKNILSVNAGFTHLVKFVIPNDLEVKLESPIKLVISGIEKEKVGFLADKIRAVKPPEPYKGKGILYEGEKIRRKAGKTGK